MGLKPISSMEIYFLMGFKGSILVSYNFILSFQLVCDTCLCYLPNGLFATNLKQNINHNKRKNEKYFSTLKEESYLKDIL